MILKIKFNPLELKNRLRSLQVLAASHAWRLKDLDAKVFLQGAAKGEPADSTGSRQLRP